MLIQILLSCCLKKACLECFHQKFLAQVHSVAYLNLKICNLHLEIYETHVHAKKLCPSNIVYDLSINLINVINETHYIVYVNTFFIILLSEQKLLSYALTKLNVFAINLKVCILDFITFT